MDEFPAAPAHLQTLGFSPIYRCQIDPEFPGAGDWGYAALEFAYPHSKQQTASSRSPMSQPLIVRITADDGLGWVGTFGGWDEWGMRAAYACPHPEMLLIVAGGVGYLLNIRNPSAYVAIPALPIRDVQGTRGAAILIGADFTKLFAVDDSGLRWVSERLCLDQLKIITATAEEVAATGSFGGSSSDQAITIDMNSGRKRSGPSYR